MYCAHKLDQGSAAATTAALAVGCSGGSGTAGTEYEHARGSRNWRQWSGSGMDAGSQGTGGNKAGEGWRKEMNQKENEPPPPLSFIEP